MKIYFVFMVLTYIHTIHTHPQAVKDQGGDAAPIVTPVAVPKAEEPVATTPITTTADNKIGK